MPKHSDKTNSKDRLIEIVKKHTLFLDQNRVPYVWIHDNTTSKVLKVNSEDFRGWIGSEYFETYETSYSKEGMEEAVFYMEALVKAKLGKQLFPLSVRFAHINGCSYLDLCDDSGRIVKISPSGWDTILEYRPTFRRYEHQLEIRVPSKATTSIQNGVEKLFELIPIKTNQDKLKILAWMVSLLISPEPRQILFFNGAQGSGKTTSARIIKSILDPSEHDVILPPKDEDLPLVLSQNGILLLDNNIVLTKRQTQTLCMAVTGGSLPKRALYTNDETRYLKFSTSAIMTAITLPTNAPDMLQRLLIVDLEPIRQNQYKNQSELFLALNENKPTILGSLLDLAVRVKAKLEGYHAIAYSRFGDFSKIGQIVAEEVGFTAKDFVNALKENTVSQEQEIRENPIFNMVREFVEGQGLFHGTSRDMLEKLKSSYESIVEKQRLNPNALTRFIKKHTVAFENVGISIQSKKKNQGVYFTLVYENPSSLSSPSSHDLDSKPLISQRSDKRAENDEFYLDEGMIPDPDLEKEPQE